MKHMLFIVVALIASVSSFGQSRSFSTLEKKFSAEDDVFSFHTSGFFARTVLMLAGEHEFRKAIRKVSDIRFITIPHATLRAKGLSPENFGYLVKSDSYDELMRVRDNGDNVSIYLQTIRDNTTNRYLILIHNPEELVAVEVKGLIDINALDNTTLLASESE